MSGQVLQDYVGEGRGAEPVPRARGRDVARSRARADRGENRGLDGPAAASAPQLWRSSIAALRIVPHGFATPWPAMSGAEPWIGS